MKLATFDIFDTTLIRRCGRPETVPHLVAERLWPGNSMRHTEYVNVRRQASAQCGEDASIKDIYVQPGFTHFPEYTAEQIMHAEMTVESEMLTANPIIREKIDRLRNEGWSIKFLSDMYLGADFLSGILRREGCLKDGDEVIVSCEANARKDNGRLYVKVQEMYHPTRWIHFGDNSRSDYKMARKHGVKAELVDFGFTSIEQRLNHQAGKTADGWKMWLLTGASHTARIKNLLDPAGTLAADYIAALYIPFVLWVLDWARKNGIGRLHFLSRDGYIMQKIAEVAGYDDIELNYLFVSRKALMRAYLSQDSADRFIEITDRRTLIGQHVNDLLKRLQLDRKELQDKYDIVFEYNRIVTPGQQQDFLSKLFDNNQFTPMLMESFRSDASLTEDYLRSQGLSDGSNQAMVDIGWLGTSRLMINRILGTDIPTLYVGVRGDVYDRSCGDYDSYFPTGRLDTSATGLIENYFSASPWPSTIGYTQDSDGSIKPKFAVNEQFTVTTATETNEKVCTSIMAQLRPYIHLFEPEMLRQWAVTTIGNLANMADSINLKPLMTAAAFDGVAMVKRFTPLQLINFILCGARYTAFDRGSLDITTGHRLAKSAWRLHDRSANLRRRLYTLMLRLKNR